MILQIMSLSKLLQIDPFIPETEIVPSEVVYLEYFNTGTPQKQSYDIKPPTSRSLLDSEVWIRHTLKFEDKNAFGGILDLIRLMFEISGNENMQDARLAFRQGFVTHSSIENIRLYINNTEILGSPKDWVDHVMRFYITERENQTVVTMSGGKIDEGVNMFYTQAGTEMVGDFTIPAGAAIIRASAGYGAYDPRQTGLAPPIANLRTHIMPSNEFHNPGFDYRFSQLWKHSRRTATNIDTDTEREEFLGGQGRFGSDFEVQVWERVPIAPFHLWDMKDRRNMIPHIREMQLRLDYTPNKLSNFCSGFNSILANRDWELNIKCDFLNSKSSIRCRWITPPLDLKIPRSVAIPMCQFRMFRKSLPVFAKAAEDFHSSTKIDIFNDIRLEQIPDLFFIYITPDKSLRNVQHPSEFCCEIRSIDFRIEGNAGKLVRIKAEELYVIYSRNMKGDKRLDWISWSRYFCTVVLKPEDIGIKSGRGSGSGVPIIISITIAYRYWYTWPETPRRDRIGGLPGVFLDTNREAIRNLMPQDVPMVMYVACEYKKYKLEMHRDAPSKYSLYQGK